MSSPLDQFQIKSIVALDVAGLNLAYTNSALWMTIAAGSAALLLLASAKGARLVPGRLQSVGEIMYDFIAGMLRENVGKEGKKYFPFFFTLFCFVLFGNLAGMIPGSFTFTSHIIVTFTMAFAIFAVITAIGFARHGLHFLHLFFPSGAPLATAPILIPIEVISYLSRPISLSIRLFANMTVGHIIMKLFAGFVVSLGAYFVIPGAVPFAILVGISALEFFVAAVQAYIFTILSCIYLNDAINMH